MTKKEWKSASLATRAEREKARRSRSRKMRILGCSGVCGAAYWCLVAMLAKSKKKSEERASRGAPGSHVGQEKMAPRARESRGDQKLTRLTCFLFFAVCAWSCA